MSARQDLIRSLIRDSNNYKSCDEGMVGRYAQCEQNVVNLPDSKIHTLHLSWRQLVLVTGLDKEEVHALVSSGYDIRSDDDNGPYVRALEWRRRHRYLSHNATGWCISTYDGLNFRALFSCNHTAIPTIKVTKWEETLLGLHDAYRTLKEELKAHGILPEFMTQQEKIFTILGNLLEITRQQLGIQIPNNEVKMGVASSVG